MTAASKKTRSPPSSPSELVAPRRVGELDVDLPSMAVISNVFRVANAARNYMERHVLKDFDLTFSGFTVLWVLWVTGSMETRHIAAEAAITKGTLTGVLKTLESQKLVERVTPESDRRLTLVHLTRKGEQWMRRIYPKFNQVESRIVATLDGARRDNFLATLRRLLYAFEALSEA